MINTTPLRAACGALFAILVASASSLHAQGDDGVYRLKPNDQIRLNVFQEPDLMADVQLTLSGEASFPLIGSVPLGGKSLKEAEEEVTALYNADYLVEPKVSINLVNAAAQRVTVTGAVNKPGEVILPPDATIDLANVIDWAGGLAANAETSRIELKRGDTTQIHDIEVLRRKGAKQVVLQNGDRVNVPANAFAGRMATVVGEVTRAGEIAFPADGRLDLDTAIGIAGGLTEAADPDRITVKRGEKLFSAELGAGNRHLLAPGDVINVPPSRFVGKTVTVLGKVARPGNVEFPLDGNLDILTAIALAGGFDRLANQKRVTVTRRVAGRPQSQRLDLTDMAEGKIPLFQLVPGDTISVPERRF